MKLVRFGAAGAERPGIWLENAEPEAQPMLLDVRAMAFDIEDYNEHFFAHFGLERVANLLREPGRKLVPAEGVRLGPPIARPGKIICLGKNYAAHAQEFDAKIPETPILGMVQSSRFRGSRLRRLKRPRRPASGPLAADGKISNLHNCEPLNREPCPILFSKAPTALIGPADPIILPEGVTQVDSEVELAVVIGKTA